MTAQSIYTTGWLKLKCVSCGKKTRERVHHEYNADTGFSDIAGSYSPKIPQHWQCHNQQCQYEDCKKLRSSVKKF